VAIRTAEVVSQKEKIEKQHGELKIEKKKSDDLLLNILPGEIAEELKETGHSEARFFNNVTVLFTDFVDFTQAGERMAPQELVDELHTCFKTFDEIISKYNIEKIKTIGDAYLAVCGLPMPVAEHAANVVKAALEIKQFMVDRKLLLKDKVFEVRIGIHSGSVVAGIVGVKKFAYDIWGDTVNTAARMEQNSEAGKINISQTTYELVKDQFICAYRGEITAKNKGELSMYFVDKQIE
jgi:adenylate cyclase